MRICGGEMLEHAEKEVTKSMNEDSEPISNGQPD